MKRYLIALLLLPAIAQAGDLPSLGGEPVDSAHYLSEVEMVKEAAFLALLAVDYGQTKSISDSCGMDGCKYHETNSILGEHPCDARIRNYFVAAALAHVLLTLAMPPEYRWILQDGGIAIEGYVTAKNARLGLRIKF